MQWVHNHAAQRLVYFEIPGSWSSVIMEPFEIVANALGGSELPLYT